MKYLFPSHLALAGIILLAIISCQPRSITSSKQEESTKQHEPSKQYRKQDSNFCLSAELKPLIKTVRLEKRAVEEQFNFVGQVSYNEDEVVSISPTLTGTVKQVYVNLGDFVEKGQLLASIQSTEIHELAQEIQQNKNSLQALQQRLKRQQAMLADGLIAAAELEETQVEMQNLQASTKQLQRNSRYYNANTAAGLFEVRAPKQGYIVDRMASPGKNIEALQEPLFVLSNLHEVWVLMNIYARDLKQVQKGAAVTVETAAYPQTKFHGKIARIAHVFNQEEHVLKAYVTLDNKELQLKPGMSAEIQLSSPHSQDSLVAIPNSLLIFHQDQHYALRYIDDCHIEPLAVKAVYKNKSYSYVAAGFQVGDQLISANELLIFEALNSK